MAQMRNLQAIKDEVRYLRDRQDILDCIRRYSHGVDRHDEEEMASIYHPDAIDDHGRFLGTVSGFTKWVNELHSASYNSHTHQLTNHYAYIDGTTAHAETYVLFVLRRKDNTVINFGSARYIDRLQKKNGRWGIMLRRITMDWRFQAPSSWDMGRWNNVYMEPTWDHSDPSYMRPLKLSPELQKQLEQAGPLANRHYTGPKLDFSGMPNTKGLSADQKIALIEKHVGYLRDRRDIWDSILRYSRGVDRHDDEIIAAAYHPDAIEARLVNQPPGTVVTIPEFIARVNKGHEDTTLGHAHHITNHNCEITGNVAHAESYVLFCLRQKQDGVINFGSARYVDKLEKRNGKWAISIRRCVLDWRFQGNARIDPKLWAVDGNNYTPPAWNKNDLSYMRPLDLTPEQKQDLAKRGLAAE